MKIDKQQSTRLVHGGKSPKYGGGMAVNTPVVRASTVTFESMAQWSDVRARRGSERLFTYGARGTPTSFALEDMITELEGGHRTRLFPTGLAAIAMMLLAYLRPGDHLLISDSCYLPVRNVVRQFLEPYGIQVDYFAADGCDLEHAVLPETRMIYLETPGSLVYEMVDMSAICRYAKSRNILVAADNTWGSGLLYRPLSLGADISVMAATKYLGGHSDVMMGAVCTTEQHWNTLAVMSDAFGMTVSPDDAWLVLRGVRTLEARLRMHEDHALQVATWLQRQTFVERVYCPALPDDPGHALWQRDCAGTNGLLSFSLHGATLTQAEQALDALALFGLGASWGGYESLASIADMQAARSLADWPTNSPVVRLHIGLENPDELIRDLEQAFAYLAV